MTITDHDAGDEHVDRSDPAPTCDPIAALLELFGSGHEVTPETMDAITFATAARDCCRACALEVNGEDGS